MDALTALAAPASVRSAPPGPACGRRWIPLAGAV